MSAEYNIRPIIEQQFKSLHSMLTDIENEYKTRSQDDAKYAADIIQVMLHQFHANTMKGTAINHIITHPSGNGGEENDDN